MSSGISRLEKTQKVISFEDPVENRLPSVCQVQVNSKNPKTTFAAYSRTAVRQDPDVVVYGEIRDNEVLRQAQAQANTGHLILSTLHTNGAAEAPARLVDLGMTWPDVAMPGLLRAVVASRLIPKLCPDCRTTLGDALERDWASDDHRRIHDWFQEHEKVQHNPELMRAIHTGDIDKRPTCKTCQRRGFVGRAPLVEIIILDNEGRRYLTKGDTAGWISHLKDRGWTRMFDKGVEKILHSETCPLELERSLETPFGINVDHFDYTEFEQRHKRVKKAKLEHAVKTHDDIAHDGVAHEQ